MHSFHVIQYLAFLAVVMVNIVVAYSWMFISKLSNEPK